MVYSAAIVVKACLAVVPTSLLGLAGWTHCSIRICILALTRREDGWLQGIIDF